MFFFCLLELFNSLIYALSRTKVCKNIVKCNNI